MTNDIAISVKDLKKVYSPNTKNEKLALNNVSLNIKKGAIFGLLGPNGAGKSTFINILADLVRKNSGNIKILGFDHQKYLKKVKTFMGIVPQELNIDPFFTPYELLEIQAGLFGIPKNSRRTFEILRLLRLENKAHAYARTLSGGMRRRLLIAKAMVHDPEILILDEPTAGVDVELRSDLWKNICRLNKKGKTIILTTHYLHEAEELCNEIAIIDKGKLIAIDTTSKIKSLINKKELIISFDDNNFNLKPITNLNAKVEIKENLLKIIYKPEEILYSDILNAIQNSNIQINDIKINETRLEDVFLKLTKN